MPRILIIGGGISGLALAYRLEQRLPAAEVLVLEQQARVGGTIDTIERDGFRVEAGPNGFLDTKPATIDLCRELGLGQRLTAASEAAGRNRFLLLDGRLCRLPSGLLSFLTSDVLSWRGKYRLLTERFRPSRRESGDESIDAFARRRVGDEIAETLVDAFVTGIHAGDPTLLSVQAAFPRLAAFEREQGSVTRGFAHARRQRRAEAGTRTGRMWSFREGLGLLIATLRERLRTPLLTGVSVRTVERDAQAGIWRVRAEGRDAWTADAVALTCPAYQQAALLDGFDAQLAQAIGSIPYNRVVVVGLGYRTADVPVSTEGFGYLSLQRSRRDVLGVQWCSSIFPGRAPPGQVLLRAMCGGWHRPEVVDWDDERLLQAVRLELAQTMGIQASPVFHHIVRWHRAIPQYHLGHLDRVAAIATRAASHAGLFLGGNAYHGVAMNDCVEQAGMLAERMAAYLNRRTT
jgi:oxygen-dependent protoporphyrinogen oxidase